MPKNAISFQEGLYIENSVQDVCCKAFRDKIHISSLKSYKFEEEICRWWQQSISSAKMSLGLYMKHEIIQYIFIPKINSGQTK